MRGMWMSRRIRSGFSKRVLDAFFSVVRFQCLVPEGSEQIHHQLQVRRIVFDYENASRGTSSSAGIEMVKRLPLPYSLWKETRPPIMPASFWLTCSPKPVPS